MRTRAPVKVRPLWISSLWARPSIPLLRHQPVSLTSSGHLETGLATQCGASRFALVAQRTRLRRTRILRLQVQSKQRTGWTIKLAEAHRGLAPAPVGTQLLYP